MYMQIWAKRHLRLVIFTNSMPTAGENKMECFFLDEYYVFRYTNIK